MLSSSFSRLSLIGYSTPTSPGRHLGPAGRQIFSVCVSTPRPAPALSHLERAKACSLPHAVATSGAGARTKPRPLGEAVLRAVPGPRACQPCCEQRQQASTRRQLRCCRPALPLACRRHRDAAGPGLRRPSPLPRLAATRGGAAPRSPLLPFLSDTRLHPQATSRNRAAASSHPP